MICCDGMFAIFLFFWLMVVSILAILIFTIIGTINNKARKITKPYSMYLLGSAISFIIGATGCIIIDHLSLKIDKALDDWGAVCIVIASTLLSFWVGLKAWRKAKLKNFLKK